MAESNSRRGRKPGEQPFEPTPQRGSTIRSPRREAAAALMAAETWTLAAMERAEPYPMPEVSLEQVERIERAGAGEVRPGLVRGRPPQQGRTADRPSTVEGALGYPYPAPYTRYELPEPLYAVYPWITCGKVFFKQHGRSYVGSASSIGNNAIWTAGHIVHAGDNTEAGWSTDMIFVPAYRDGDAPFGRWSVSYSRTTTGWYQKGNPDGLSADIAGAVCTPSTARPISDRVGSLGFVWNLPRAVHWHALGYPAAAPFDGEVMHDCQASYAYDGVVAGVKPVAIGCDMTGGCSGGPWVYKLLDENALNGNNSYRLTTRPEEMNSPYFDDSAKTLYDQLLADVP